jgi:hypothetical protein
MVDYTPLEDYSAKDSLTPADPEKAISGADIDAELDAISSAVNGRIEDPGVGTAGNVLTVSGSSWVSAAPVQQGNLAYVEDGTYQAFTTAFNNTGSPPVNTVGTELMTVNITPTHADNQLLILVNCPFTGTINQLMSMAVFRDATSAAVAATGATTSGLELQHMTLMTVVTAGSTSTSTFKLRVGPSSGNTMYVNGSTTTDVHGSVNVVSMAIMEIKSN